MIESKLKDRREIRLTIGESTGILQIPDDFAKIEFYVVVNGCGDILIFEEMPKYISHRTWGTDDPTTKHVLIGHFSGPTSDCSTKIIHSSIYQSTYSF